MLHPTFSPPNLFVREFSDEVHWGEKIHHNVSGAIPWIRALNSMKKKLEAGHLAFIPLCSLAGEQCALLLHTQVTVPSMSAVIDLTFKC